MPRILVVEDEPDIALGLQEDLRCHGYEVETVADGESAARRGKEPGWDLILLDLMLPLMDGYEVCQQLRHAGVRTPIIMLTAKTHEAEKVMGLDLGARVPESLFVRLDNYEVTEWEDIGRAETVYAARELPKKHPAPPAEEAHP